MKLVIIGGVAGGATAAARARRLNENAEIVMFERGEFISFANCGLPYHIGGVIKQRRQLLVITKEEFSAQYNTDIRTYTEVLSIDRENKTIKAKNLQTGEEYTETYDKMILSPGAEPIRPPIDGIDHENIFTLRNIPDTDRIKEFIDTKNPEAAVVIGGGFIGLEMAENLVGKDIDVTLVEMLDQVMAPLDIEMANKVHEELSDEGITLELNNAVTAFKKTGDRITVVTKSGAEFECDMVILAIGVKPENKLAKDAGLPLNQRGGIIVDSTMRTADPDIYAVGDAVEIRDFQTGLPAMIPLAGPANRQARVAADNVMGRSSVYKGAQGTSVLKLFDLTVASTGANEKFLKANNIPCMTSYTHSSNHSNFYPGAEPMSIKLIFSPGNGKVLGAQIVGTNGVDKRIDVIATAIRGNMTVYDLEELELAYAPPFGAAKDPINIAGSVASNMLRGDFVPYYWAGWDKLDPEKEVVLDLRKALDPHMEGAMHIPLSELRDRFSELDKDKTYLMTCGVGVRGYMGYRVLNQRGYKGKGIMGGDDTVRYAVGHFELDD